MKNHADEHEAFAASRSSEHVYVPIDDRNFTTLDKHAETIEMDAKLPLVSTLSLEHATEQQYVRRPEQPFSVYSSAKALYCCAYSVSSA